jgi:hypothetical protein
LSFVVWAALAIAGFVVGPVIAHLLRRGRAREREFPAAALVPPLTSTARQRSRFEDWTLLVLRSLLIVGLAVLGATPLVRCERLSLARASGASVALVIVMDDSLSMRTLTPTGKQRWALAKAGAEQLLRSAREGDAVAIVLAGRPARIALAPTTDLRAAERALDDLVPSDRSTDLVGAVQLARTALHSLPQKDRRVVALTDLAGEPIPPGEPLVSTPIAELAQPARDCGITSAERRGAHVTVSVACSSDEAAKGRSVEVVATAALGEAPGGPGGDAGAPRVTVGEVVAHAELPRRTGEQSVVLGLRAAGGAFDARLTGSDAANRDDLAPVSDDSSLHAVAVIADATIASARTGGPTVVEQALAALGEDWAVRPLPFVPDDPTGLDGIGALVLDDPRGLSPEARATIERFFGRGGVAVALLGPRSAATELGWTLEPFSRGAARWDGAQDLGIDPASVAWLGPEAASLGGIGRRGRVRLEGMLIEGARVVGRWSDGVPWLVERRLGRGLAITAGLPASLDESDLAVRPGFVALLDHVLHQADQRAGSRRTTAGGTWTFSDAKRVSIDGPDGPVPAAPEQSDEACADRGAKPGCGDTVVRAQAALRGRYTVHLDRDTEVRIATLDPAEILTEPRASAAGGVGSASRPTAAPMNITREVALALIALFAAELGVRLARKWAARRQQRDPAAAT